MYCKNCGEEIVSTSKFCPKCGALTINAQEEPLRPAENPPFSTWKLVSGILSIIFFSFFFMFSSCAAAVSEEGSQFCNVAGTLTVASALAFAGGIVSIASRNSWSAKGDIAVAAMGILTCALSCFISAFHVVWSIPVFVIAIIASCKKIKAGKRELF